MSMVLCPESLGRLATPAFAPSPLDTSPQGAPPFFEPRHVQRVHPKLFVRSGKPKEFKRVEVGLAK